MHPEPGEEIDRICRSWMPFRVLKLEWFKVNLFCMLWIINSSSQNLSECIEKVVNSNLSDSYLVITSNANSTPSVTSYKLVNTDFMPNGSTIAESILSTPCSTPTLDSRQRTETNQRRILQYDSPQVGDDPTNDNFQQTSNNQSMFSPSVTVERIVDPIASPFINSHNNNNRDDPSFEPQPDRDKDSQERTFYLEFIPKNQSESQSLTYNQSRFAQDQLTDRDNLLLNELQLRTMQNSTDSWAPIELPRPNRMRQYLAQRTNATRFGQQDSRYSSKVSGPRKYIPIHNPIQLGGRIWRKKFRPLEDLQTSAHNHNIRLSNPRDLSVAQHALQQLLMKGAVNQQVFSPAQPVDAALIQSRLESLSQQNLNSPMQFHQQQHHLRLPNLIQSPQTSLGSVQLPKHNYEPQTAPDWSSMMLESAPVIPYLNSASDASQRPNTMDTRATNSKPSIDSGELSGGSSSTVYSLMPDGKFDSSAQSPLHGLNTDQLLSLLNQPSSPQVNSNLASSTSNSVESPKEMLFQSYLEQVLKDAITQNGQQTQQNLYLPQSSTSQQSSAQVSSNPQTSLSQLAQITQTNQPAAVQPAQPQSTLPSPTPTTPTPAAPSQYAARPNPYSNMPSYQMSSDEAPNHHLMMRPSAESMMNPDQSQYYGQPHHGKKKRNKNKGSAGSRDKSNKRPQVRVSKRPRAGSASNQAYHDIDSPNDLQTSATLHKWKYPWLYRPPFDYDDDEEEGETEVNIRFFNNFSRLGPLGGLARSAGPATLVVSLIFLLLSNISLAATVIVHGISSFLRNMQGGGGGDRRGPYPATVGLHKPARSDLTGELMQPMGIIRALTSGFKSSKVLKSSKAKSNSTTRAPSSTTSVAPLDEKIKSFGHVYNQT